MSQPMNTSFCGRRSTFEGLARRFIRRAAICAELCLAGVLVAGLIQGSIASAAGETPTAGATYYVSPTGSDSNAGTAAAPWRTPQRAIDLMGAGDTALVRAGIYTGQVRCDAGKAGSAAGGYETLRAYPGEKPILTGAIDGIVRIACDYFALEGFDIAGPSVVGGTNIYPAGGSHVLIADNDIHGAVCQGISMDSSTSYYELLRNRIHHNGVTSTPCDQQAHGLYLQGDSHLVRDNLIYNNHDYGIQAYPYGRDNIIMNNDSSNNGKAGIVVGGSGSGLSGSGVAGITVVANILASNGTWGIHVTSPAPTSCDFHGNVVYGNASGAIEAGFPSGCVGSNIFANPMFVDQTALNYHLQAGSPAIDVADGRDAGQTDFEGTPRPQGPGIDIGAYERATGVTVPSPPSNTALPVVTGTAQAGASLSASSGTWTNTPTAFGYQWRRCDSTGASCASITGATLSTFALTATDVGSSLRVLVTATNGAGSSSATSLQTAVVAAAPAPVALPPANTSLPTIGGIAVDGQTLTAANGTWANTPTAFGYQWRRCDSTGASCASIIGATLSTFALTAADVGSSLRLAVTASNRAGSSSATSLQTAVVAAAPAPVALPPANTASPTISGVAVDGRTLTAARGTWANTPTAFGYQWHRCDALGASCANIIGATLSTFALTAADVGSALRVSVTASNGAGSSLATSTQTAVVSGLAPANLIRPALVGTAVVGTSVGISVGTWAGTVPLQFTVAWWHCNRRGKHCSAILGATGMSYTLTSADGDSRVFAWVTATNTVGTASAKTSVSAVVK